MATFNGWSIVSLPSSPAAPATIDYTANDVVAVSVSPFTGQQQIQNWQSSWLEASVSMPPLTHSQAQAWIAFLMALQGQANVFQLGDPVATAPRGSASGVPLVNGGSQVGYALLTKGWASNAVGVLLPGDWLQIGYRLYRNLVTVNTDAGGNATLSIWPQLRESPADGTPLTLTNTKGLWRLKANARKWSTKTSRIYGLQFDIREAI